MYACTRHLTGAQSRYRCIDTNRVNKGGMKVEHTDVMIFGFSLPKQENIHIFAGDRKSA